MKGELVRIKTKDNLELQGLLFEPKESTNKVIVHIHGWIGNFYENEFIEHIAKAVNEDGISFLTFNTRGVGFVTDFKKGDKYERIGGSLEIFEDCRVDVNAAIDYLDDKGYKEFVLQGHSLGCQKIVYYKFKTKNEKVRGLILLAPVDDIAYVTSRFDKEKYKESLKIAHEMVKKGEGQKPVPGWMQYYPMLSANMFITVSDPESTSGKIFLYSGQMKEIKGIKCPILAVFGSKDQYQSNPEKMLKILKEKADNCTTHIIKGANHWLKGSEEELAKKIADFSTKIYSG